MPTVLIGGQSNVPTFNNAGPAPYVPTWRVQIWTDTNGNGAWDLGDNFNAMVPGVNTGSFGQPAAWGPEVAIANAWLADGGQGGILWIGKVAKGETTIVANDGLDWAPGSAGELFDMGAFVAQSMRANLGVDALDAVFWMEGETAAQVQAWAQAYGDALADFLPAVRERWMGDPDGRIVLARIGDGPALPYGFDVRLAQWQAAQADPNTEGFRTLDLERQADGLHLAPVGVLAVGQGFYDHWMA